VRGGDNLRWPLAPAGIGAGTGLASARPSEWKRTPIGVTQFFRDPEAYDRLEHDVVPQILDAVPPHQELRVWCAGCATGEEAYSLAMLFYEGLAARNRPIHLKVLATDVHPASLEHASHGITARSRSPTSRRSGSSVSSPAGPAATRWPRTCAS
jgi:chemotaxis methyl-accepting protein methylase